MEERGKKEGGKEPLLLFIFSLTCLFGSQGRWGGREKRKRKKEKEGGIPTNVLLFLCNLPIRGEDPSFLEKRERGPSSIRSLMCVGGVGSGRRREGRGKDMYHFNHPHRV